MFLRITENTLSVFHTIAGLKRITEYSLPEIYFYYPLCDRYIFDFLHNLPQDPGPHGMPGPKGESGRDGLEGMDGIQGPPGNVLVIPTNTDSKGPDNSLQVIQYPCQIRVLFFFL